VPVLERQGVHLEYDVHGRSGPGTPLLLTHGYGASRKMWEPNVEALSCDRPVISWDMRGHGASDSPDDPVLYTHMACLLDMAALLDRAGAPRAVLCGMSLGGFLSLLFNAHYRDRVAALVLVDTGPGFRNPDARERWNAWALERADELEARGLSALPGSREQSPDQHINGGGGLARAARGILVQGDATVFESLDAVAAPTLIVVGSEDTQFLAAAEVMERHIAGAKRIVLEGAGHAANMDAPDQFNAAVTEFLEEF
jgi:pimeloyl-ACP methyl ester carboxylesterase